MGDGNNTVQKQIELSAALADRLSRLAQDYHVTEDRIVEKALDILFSLTDIFEPQVERQGWSLLSQDSLARVWNNDEDAVYDNWRDLYDVAER